MTGLEKIPSILERCAKELAKVCDDAGGCDHEVGICCCDLYQLIGECDKARALLLEEQKALEAKADEGLREELEAYIKENNHRTACSSEYEEGQDDGYRYALSDIQGLIDSCPLPSRESNRVNGVQLPKGRTCRSCLHTPKCKEISIYRPDSTECDFNPCRYAEYHGDMTPEPMFMREVCEALGWQGGTVHDAIKEIKRLRHPSPSRTEELVKAVREWDGHYCEGEIPVESREILWQVLADFEKGAS